MIVHNKNQKGSALVYTMVALSVMMGTSAYMFQKTSDSKSAEADLAKSQYVHLFKRKITTLLSDPDTCLANFGGAIMDSGQPQQRSDQSHTDDQYQPQEALLNIKDSHSKVIYATGKKYYGNAVLFHGVKLLPHPTEPSTKFIMDLSFSKGQEQNTKGQKQNLTLNMTAVMEGNVIQSCRYEGSASFDVNEELAKLCQGPGMISNQNGVCVIANPHPELVKACPDGQGVVSITQDAENKIISNCGQIITQPAACEFGVKYTGEAGKYGCLSLEEIIDTSVSSVSVGSSCRIIVDSGRYVFKCN